MTEPRPAGIVVVSADYQTRADHMIELISSALHVTGIAVREAGLCPHQTQWPDTPTTSLSAARLAHETLVRIRDEMRAATLRGRICGCPAPNDLAADLLITQWLALYLAAEHFLRQPEIYSARVVLSASVMLDDFIAWYHTGDVRHLVPVYVEGRWTQL